MPPVALAQNAMATRFELVLYGERESLVRAAGEEALAEIDRLENQLSRFRPGSEIFQLNQHAASAAVQVSAEVFALLQRAAEYARATAGAFDITVGPLLRAWGFEQATGRESTDAERARSRAGVGMEKVALDATQRTVRFTHPGVSLDLGALGKGYAIDRCVMILREAGVNCGLVHGGTSTVAALGGPPERGGWEITLPVAPPGCEAVVASAAPVVSLRDEALSVSAVWGRQRELAGQWVGHVFDPRTGQPVAPGAMAAVVLPSATETDALSTALLTLGRGGWERLRQYRPGVRAWLGNAQGVVALGG